MSDLSDDELLAELGVSLDTPKTGGRTPRQERLIAGFEDILRFVEVHGRAPLHGERGDIFERLYAVRLDRLRALPEARELLMEFDTQGLLNPALPREAAAPDTMDDDALLAELNADAPAADDIAVLRHVVSRADRRAAEEIANRDTCQDFAQFEPLFQLADTDLKTGRREARRFGKDAAIKRGEFFILGGQVVYVAEEGPPLKAPNGESDARLRVIYSNGTESNLLRRSLQRALYKDDAGRRLTEPNDGPLFAETWEEDDVGSGTIYVLRSLSNHPYIAEHREIIHKIGVTRGEVETRIVNAPNDPTYLMAEVEVLATYKLASVNRTKLEALFHNIFASGRLDITIPDRFGRLVRPHEWYRVPLQVIDEAVQRIRDGSITNVSYDPQSLQFSTKIPSVMPAKTLK